MNILGISSFYHDSAACLVQDGRIIAAAQEERFSRKKHDAGYPRNAIRYCLEEAGVGFAEVDYVTFYDKPFIKFERLLETYLAFAPRGIHSFVKAIPVWLKEKLFLKTVLRREYAALAGLNEDSVPPLLFSDHHRSHAASAFYPSPYEKAAVLCLDGVGEWAATSVWMGDGNILTPAWQINFPHSLGLLYSAFTYYTGFKVNSGEYKLMGLAPYGRPKYVDLILNHLLDLKEDGTFRLAMEYFDYPTGLRMTNSKFHALFGGPPRKPEGQLTQREMDIASSIQVVTEEVVLRQAKAIHRETGADYLCLAGGVALNCVANGRLLREGPYKDIWIQPAAGDAGGAVGAALSTWHEYLQHPRHADNKNDLMSGSYLGCHFSNEQIRAHLDELGASYREIPDDILMPKLADILAHDNVVGWFSGRMEFGPRALGSRSIIGDPRSRTMQTTMNLKIKYRESFRPFAPAIKAERVAEWFEHDRCSPYMLLVACVAADKRIPMSAAEEQLFGIDKLKVPRSEIPAVTHVDHSARIQTVHRETNPRFYALIDHFERHTGCPILVNTSFNVRGEPIVRSPADAYRCFMRTEMDYLVMENVLLAKKDQPKWHDDGGWKDEFELD